ncbi:MAG TPA: DUF2127 domain-containing protein [Steroidobacteraceae bacterium]|jgi:uncharacterized membrane protein (DUF2068 family)
MIAPDGQAPAPRFGMLRTIALYKLLKVLLLLLAAYGELRLHDASLSAKLVTWAEARPSGLEHEAVTRILEWFSGLSESKIHALRFVTFTYAAVFAVEGIGLWMQKRWAEWLTTIITASLIPLEIWEFVHRPNLGKAAVVIANTAIVAYLFWHVRARGQRKSVRRAPGKRPPGGAPGDGVAGDRAPTDRGSL